MVYGSSKNIFWPLKNSGEVLDKFKARDISVASLSIYQFSTLYITLPRNVIKDSKY